MKKKVKVSVQGFQGCFHQDAAIALLGEDIELLGCSTFRELVKKVESGESDKGVMAIENSITGSILQNYTLLQNANLKITGEIHLRIHQNLLGVKGSTIEDITEIQSHPIALLQCSKFFEENWDDSLKLVESRDTGYSAEMVSKWDNKNIAAVGSKLAASLYGLDILAEDIHSVTNNYTRFLLIEREDNVLPVLGSNKASLYFKIAHERGSLASVLNSFDKFNVNMTKLQSSPVPSDPFRYMFHTDMEFDHLEEFLTAVDSAKKVMEELQICGIYKRGNFIE